MQIWQPSFFTCRLRAVRRKLIRDSLRVVRELHKFFGKLLRRESVERLAFSSALKLAQPPTFPPDLDTPKTLAATLPLPPDLSKIVKKHPATSTCRTLRLRNPAFDPKITPNCHRTMPIAATMLCRSLMLKVPLYKALAGSGPAKFKTAPQDLSFAHGAFCFGYGPNCFRSWSVFISSWSVFSSTMDPLSFQPPRFSN